MHTFSQANSTGAVAKPNFRSAAVGLPMASLLDTKSNRSSTSWNARPMLRPYSNDTSTNWSSAPANIASCEVTTTKWMIKTEKTIGENLFFCLECIHFILSARDKKSVVFIYSRHNQNNGPNKVLLFIPQWFYLNSSHIAELGPGQCVYIQYTVYIDVGYTVVISVLTYRWLNS